MERKYPSLLNNSEVTNKLESQSPYIVVDNPDSEWIPTYHSLIERNISNLIQSELQPYVQQIKKIDETESIINDYKIGSTIGSGQFGKVYKGQEQSHKKRRIVALKRINKLRPKYSMNQLMRQITYWKQFNIDADNFDADTITTLMNVNRCRWEVYLMLRVTNDRGGNSYVVNFLQCMDSVNSKDLWIVSEWCNLGELQWKRPTRHLLEQWESLIGENKTVADFAFKVINDITKGLKFLKKIGCIHRDIKPSNILVDGKNKILKISDFGCSLLTPESLPFEYDPVEKIKDKQLHIVRKCFQKEMNKIIGTPAFVAPELCKFTEEDFKSEEKMDVKDGFKLDIWSFGVTLYCILFNQLPFSGDNEFDTYHLINLKELSNDDSDCWITDLVITKMLKKNPDERIDINEIHTIITSNKNNKPPSLNKLGGGAKKSIKKFWKKISKPKSKEDLTLKVTLSTEDTELSRITSRDSFASGLDPSDLPINITDFIDSLTTTNAITAQDEILKNNNKQENRLDPTQTDSPVSSSGSIQSFEIPTPIKNMIKIKASPEKPEKRDLDHGASNDGQTAPRPAPKMKSSKNIINFKNYIQNNEVVESSDTIDQIKDYLNYKGDFT
ncbi:hypothetical protein C6P45_004022 [Maudiozyma exigua]|uniref:non-specific serine/threonine protein kinase n=1 Tax=Maudiozyma exigua TaxID=34358 RepID=A0A9P6WDU7_MAUEX|nr:hypothetical protein C6P45_004022 [Kazachstania exigua]